MSPVEPGSVLRRQLLGGECPTTVLLVASWSTLCGRGEAMSGSDSIQSVVSKPPGASRSSPALTIIVALAVLGIALSTVFAHFDMWTPVQLLAQ
jgi:hypothetical protein